IAVAAKSSRRPDRLKIGPGVRLRQAYSASSFASREYRKKSVLLLFGSEPCQNVTKNRMSPDDAGQPHPNARDLFEDHRVDGRAQLLASVRFRAVCVDYTRLFCAFAHGHGC